jgi:hypothetical protein
VNKASAENGTKTNSKEQANNSSGEPSAAFAGFHNRPATRAGPYEEMLIVS